MKKIPVIPTEKKVVKPKRLKEKVVVGGAFEKKEYMYIPLPEDHVRSIVLKDYKGMDSDLYAGDIIDLPNRRFKTLSLRGLVKRYDGKLSPNKMR